MIDKIPEAIDIIFLALYGFFMRVYYFIFPDMSIVVYPLF